MQSAHPGYPACCGNGRPVVSAHPPSGRPASVVAPPDPAPPPMAEPPAPPVELPPAPDMLPAVAPPDPVAVEPAPVSVELEPEAPLPCAPPSLPCPHPAIEATRSPIDALDNHSTATQFMLPPNGRRWTVSSSVFANRARAPRSNTTAADFRCQIDHRSRHTATQPDRTGGFLASAKQGWRGVAADFVPQRDSDGLAVTCVGSAPFLPIVICRCQDRRSNIRRATAPARFG